MLSVPDSAVLPVCAPAVPAMAANAANTARRIATRLFRPSMCPSKEDLRNDRSSLWQRNHIRIGRSMDPCVSLDVLSVDKFGLPDPEAGPPAPELRVSSGDHQAHSPVHMLLDALT